MTKIIISMFLLLSLNLSADFVDEGSIEYEKGNIIGASELYTKACKNENMKGCTKLGVLYFTGNGVKENHKKAKKLFRKACKKRYPEGCFHLGTIYKRGATDIPRNFEKSKMYYALGCKMRLNKSCIQYDLVKEKHENTGSDTIHKNSNFSYTYSTQVYGG